MLFTHSSLFSPQVYIFQIDLVDKRMCTWPGLVWYKPDLRYKPDLHTCKINLDLQSDLYWTNIGLEPFYGRLLVNKGSKSCRKLHLELFALFQNCSYKPTVNSDHCFYSNSIAVNRYDCPFNVEISTIYFQNVVTVKFASCGYKTMVELCYFSLCYYCCYYCYFRYYCYWQYY